MNITVILEVAIGLVVVWFVISMATIQLQEVIANALEFRAKDLEKALGQMLSSQTLVNEFYKHPLIQGLMKNPNKKPSYIPAREFALALFNIITTAGTDQSAIQQALQTLKDTNLGQIKNWFKRSGAESTIKKLIAEVGEQNLALDKVEARLKDLRNKYPEITEENITKFKQLVTDYLISITNLPDPDTLSLSDLKIALNAIEKINPKLACALKSLTSGAESFVTDKEKGLAAARTYVETWFNNSMARLSGWYKRRSQWFAFFIGLILAVFLNIDSVAIAQKLWIDPTMRAAILEIAPSLEAPPAVTSTNETDTENTSETPDAGITEPADQQTTTKTPEEILSETRGLLEEVGLPIGWVPVMYKIQEDGQEGKTFQCALFPPEATENIFPVQGIPVKDICYRPSAYGIIESTDAQTENWFFAWIVGILISALATAQGAPFWFDLLSKLINIRGTGAKPPEETPKENAKG